MRQLTGLTLASGHCYHEERSNSIAGKSSTVACQLSDREFRNTITRRTGLLPSLKHLNSAEFELTWLANEALHQLHFQPHCVRLFREVRAIAYHLSCRDAGEKSVLNPFGAEVLEMPIFFHRRRSPSEPVAPPEHNTNCKKHSHSASAPQATLSSVSRTPSADSRSIPPRVLEDGIRDFIAQKIEDNSRIHRRKIRALQDRIEVLEHRQAVSPSEGQNPVLQPRPEEQSPDSNMQQRPRKDSRAPSMTSTQAPKSIQHAVMTGDGWQGRCLGELFTPPQPRSSMSAERKEPAGKKRQLSQESEKKTNRKVLQKVHHKVKKSGSVNF
jgi:hypothetical protein